MPATSRLRDGDGARLLARRGPGLRGPRAWAQRSWSAPANQAVRSARRRTFVLRVELPVDAEHLARGVAETNGVEGVLTDEHPAVVAVAIFHPRNLVPIDGDLDEVRVFRRRIEGNGAAEHLPGDLLERGLEIGFVQRVEELLVAVACAAPGVGDLVELLERVDRGLAVGRAFADQRVEDVDPHDERGDAVLLERRADGGRKVLVVDLEQVAARLVALGVVGAAVRRAVGDEDHEALDGVVEGEEMLTRRANAFGRGRSARDAARTGTCARH